jgi:serine/threonine protein kinase
MALSSGTQLGSFKILMPLGAGGMGEVYRATDTKLDREVAIKILPADVANDPERLSRFTREAKVLASLNHPNIATVFGVEEGALIMELIEGDTLADRIRKGPIPAEEALQIAMEIAAAMEYAHERGIIHRDLKPANVMAASRVKVLDFGLAKVRENLESDATITCETQLGVILGTAAYMSPEQASGKPADARSDVFSFGVLLYEMLSGQRAFSEESPISTLAAILHKQAKPLREIAPTVPAMLESIVARCMEKDPSVRFASMALAKKALKDLGQTPPSTAEIASIAVLPFTNLSADKENEYFSDGLAEEILIALSRVEGLRVTARSSSFSFKGKSAEMSEIASKLHVANILDGSVRRAGNRVRVTVQLVDARNGFQLWSERYDRQMEDIFEVQDEISRAIADHLKVTLVVGVKQATKNLEAYELYLKGRHLANQRMPGTVRTAIQSYEQAILLDPEFALAYSGLADCYAILRVYGWISAEEGGPSALAAMSRAVALSPNLWEVIFSRALYTFYYGRRWRDAGPDFLKAVSCNPHSSLANGYMSVYNAMIGRTDEALAHIRQACRLDPVSSYIHGLTCCSLHLLRLYDKAESYARKALELQPNYLFGLWMLGLTLSSLNRHQEAVETLEQVVAISRAPIFIGLMGCTYERAGRSEDATRLLSELEERRIRGEFVPAMCFLSIHAGKGNIPEIRRSLSEAIAESCPAFTMRLTSYPMDSFRTDPEINRMLVELLGY